MTWTKYAGVLLSFVDRKWFWFCIYYEVFLKYLCEHPRVRLTFLKVDVLNLLTSPGAFEILCQVFQNELWRIFLLPCTKVVQLAVFFRENQFINPLKLTLKKWIVQDLLTARELVEVWRWKESFLKPQKFSSFLEWLKLFSLIFGIVVVVFAGRWWSEELLQRNRFQIGQHVLDIDFWSHSDATMKDLWRRCPEDQMDDREVDSR